MLCINPYVSRTAEAPSKSTYYVWFHGDDGNWENLGPCGLNNVSMTNARNMTYAQYKEYYKD